ncbi:MAG: hypothetical protein PHE43_00285 [Candidatus Nanoarchaeia archaeon]|nr:hypothetical protein [Candidatus Nanoarchaeia archaeon]
MVGLPNTTISIDDYEGRLGDSSEPKTFSQSLEFIPNPILEYRDKRWFNIVDPDEAINYDDIGIRMPSIREQARLNFKYARENFLFLLQNKHIYPNFYDSFTKLDNRDKRNMLKLLGVKKDSSFNMDRDFQKYFGKENLEKMINILGGENAGEGFSLAYLAGKAGLINEYKYLKKE